MSLYIVAVRVESCCNTAERPNSLLSLGSYIIHPPPRPSLACCKPATRSLDHTHAPRTQGYAGKMVSGIPDIGRFLLIGALRWGLDPGESVLGFLLRWKHKYDQQQNTCFEVLSCFKVDHNPGVWATGSGLQSTRSLIADD